MFLGILCVKSTLSELYLDANATEFLRRDGLVVFGQQVGIDPDAVDKTD